MPEPTRVAQPFAEPLRIQAAPLSEPLTAAEIQALVQVAQALPGGQLPAFDSPPETVIQAPTLHHFVAAERQRLRLGLNAQWQSAQWQSNAELQQRLTELQVEPEALAALMLRVSGSWLGLDSSPQAATAQLREMEHQLARQLRWAEARQQTPMTDWEQQQLLESLQETIACAEMLNMVASVPEQSLSVVAAHRRVLAPLLPADTASQRIELRTEHEATIRQVSGWKN